MQEGGRTIITIVILFFVLILIYFVSNSVSVEKNNSNNESAVKVLTENDRERLKNETIEYFKKNNSSSEIVIADPPLDSELVDVSTSFDKVFIISTGTQIINGQ